MSKLLDAGFNSHQGIVSEQKRQVLTNFVIISSRFHSLDPICVMKIEGYEYIPERVNQDHQVDIIRISVQVAENHGQAK